MSKKEKVVIKEKPGVTITGLTLIRVFSVLAVVSLVCYGAFDISWWVDTGLYTGNFVVIRGIILFLLHAAGLACLASWIPESDYTPPTVNSSDDYRKY